jgi:hypothetical protein
MNEQSEAGMSLLQLFLVFVVISWAGMIGALGTGVLANYIFMRMNLIIEIRWLGVIGMVFGFIPFYYIAINFCASRYERGKLNRKISFLEEELRKRGTN